MSSTSRLEIDKYSRMVSFEEIERNEFNLNLPRYIDSQTPEDIQDIEGHLKGGIPAADIEALNKYWEVCPTLRESCSRKIAKDILISLWKNLQSNPLSTNILSSLLSSRT